jgi:CRISPR-associated protein Cmr6
VNDTIGNLPTGPFNFGLYFNKWFYVVDGNARPPKGLKKKSRWSCPTSVDSVLERRHEVHPQQCKLLDNLNTSLVLFNGASREDKWDRRQAEQMLSARHVSLAYYCESFRKLGYWYETTKVGLSSPLIVGLGNEHPSEKGFRFDWTLGIPMSTKGPMDTY